MAHTKDGLKFIRRQRRRAGSARLVTHEKHPWGAHAAFLCGYSGHPRAASLSDPTMATFPPRFHHFRRGVYGAFLPALSRDVLRMRPQPRSR